MAYKISEECIMCGLCQTNCPADAISEGEERYEIDPDLCISCGTCAENCPMGAISEAEEEAAEEAEETTAEEAVSSDEEKGGLKMAYKISADCIMCGSCQANCPADAIAEGDAQYVIDPDLCLSCGTCAENCPVGAISEE